MIGSSFSRILILISKVNRFVKMILDTLEAIYQNLLLKPNCPPAPKLGPVKKNAADIPKLILPPAFLEDTLRIEGCGDLETETSDIELEIQVKQLE